MSKKQTKSSKEDDGLPAIWPVIPSYFKHKTYHNHLVVVYQQPGVVEVSWRFLIVDRRGRQHWFFGPRSSCPSKLSAFLRGAARARQLNQGPYTPSRKETYCVKPPDRTR